MVDVAVALPEPRPEDDEDVVWGLSTATALWMRGERRDAIVWLRRAAESAISVGQDFRGSELGICASDLEHLLDEAAGRPMTYPPPPVAPVAGRPMTYPPPPVAPAPAARPLTQPPSPVTASARAPAGDPAAAKSPFTEPTLPSAPGLRALSSAVPPAPPPERATIDVEVDAEAPILPPPAPVRLIPPAPRAPTFSPQAFTPLPGTAAPTATGPSSYRPPPLVPAAPAPGSNPPPSGMTTSYRPPPPAPKPGPPSTQTSPGLPPPTGGNASPGTRSSTITPPPPPIAPPPPPAPAAAGSIPPDPGRSIPPASRTPSPSIRKSQPRAPILDPWAEEPTQPTGRALESIRVAQAASGDEVILSRRKRTNTRNSEDEEEVVTSAVSLDEMLGRKVQLPPPPPVRKPPVPEGMPGHLAQVAPSVPSKAPPSEAKPAAPPPSPASAPRAAPPPPPAAGGERPPSRPPSRPPAAPTVAATAPAPAVPATAIAPPAAPPAPAIASPAAPPAPARKVPSSAPPPPAPTMRAAPPLPAASTVSRPSVPPPAPAKAAPPPAPPRPTPSKAPPPPPAAPEPPAEPPSLGSVPLEDVDPFGDLPPDVQKQLVEIASARTLAADEAISGFGTALLLEGEAVITAAGSEAPASRAVRGTLIPARGSISEAPEIRLVAGPDGATVAIWDQGALEDALKSCPWVMEEITERAERLQSLAGATLGPLGEIDEMSRNQLLDQLEVRVARAGQAVAAQGEALNGVALVCAGTIELLDDTDAPWKSLGAGDLLFARAVLEGRAAPCRARAGAGGALLLVGEQGLAQALISESPELATFLSSTNE